mgnify:CR=1 FL=1
MDQFFVPTEIVFGRGALESLGKVAARFGRQALVVCGAGFARRSGLLQRTLEQLQGAGVAATAYEAVRGEANLSTVDDGIALARRIEADVVIGLGGGSAIDTAKAIAGTTPLPGSIWEYHGGRAIEAAGLPFIAVPTTAGTGAEVTKNAVLIDPRNNIKYSIRDDRWFARVAVVDPETTISLSPEVTAHTGSDALCQAIESYTSIGANAITDALALRAIELIGAHLARAHAHPEDLGAREAMMYGSLMAGMAMASARLGGVHGMAHPLGSHYGIPHGEICGLLLPYTMAYNLEYTTPKYAQVARALGLETHDLSEARAAQAAVDGVRDLLRSVGVPEHLRDYGVPVEDFDQIIAESLPSGSLQHNPRPLAAEDVRRILEAAM